jgi:alpha-ketoglutarate-dependent taurine dioxygenase
VENSGSRPVGQTLGQVRRKAMDASAASPVRQSLLAPGQQLPLVIEPAVEADHIDLAAWARQHKETLDAELDRHGAILFRGFALKTVADFEKVAGAVYPLYGGYGDLPNAGLSENIYKSTPYPADKWILFHNESSHLDLWPLRISFFCLRAAATGGETPLLDCREVYRQLDPDVARRFESKGLMYVRNFVEGFDVSWQQFFKTTDKQVVEELCGRNNVTCEWTAGNGLRLRQRTRAVTRHPRTGEMVFFNQVQLHHLSCLDADTRESLLALFKEEDLPRNVYFGDGSPIDDEVMHSLGELYMNLCVSFAWREGDIVMLDNMLAAHARKPFSGEREIVVAMGEMMDGRAA